MKSELKKYGIRATVRPPKQELVSSTVLVTKADGLVGYCYIGFDAAFVEAVGASLPRGVSKEEPAFVFASEHVVDGKEVWVIGARYLLSDDMALLWRTDKKPSWLNFYRSRAKNADSPKARSRTRAKN